MMTTPPVALIPASDRSQKRVAVGKREEQAAFAADEEGSLAGGELAAGVMRLDHDDVRLSVPIDHLRPRR